MTTPALSVAMSVFNAQPYLQAALDSILQQSFADFEFIIVDDGSTDGSTDVLRAAAAQDQRIRLIIRENRGLIASLNEIVQAARAPFIARMDADDTCTPDRFARQMAFLAANPDHGAVSAECILTGPDGTAIAPPKLTRPTTHAGILANLESGPTLLHNAVIYAREAVLAVGGYHAAFAHAEDYDLWLRLSQITKLANLPEHLVTYRQYDGQVSDRHVLAQVYNAALAWLAHAEREAGHPDPTPQWPTAPDITTIQAQLGADAAAYVCRRVVQRMLYTPKALVRDGEALLLRHARKARGDVALWKLAARLATGGQVAPALRLAVALLGG
jgi:glycosyltransferase involved in cell wall biosynthesis